MGNDNPFKNLLFLAGAAALLLLGLLLLLKIIGAVVEIAVLILPWVLIGGGIYLVYRWWTGRR